MTRLLVICLGLLILAGCEEPAPRTVSEFIDDSIALEAAIVRCDQNRAQSRLDAECGNAREALKRISIREEQARKVEFEKLSQRKREALREQQRRAEAARQRAREEQRLREEQNYLDQFVVDGESTAVPAEPSEDALQGTGGEMLAPQEPPISNGDSGDTTNPEPDSQIKNATDSVLQVAPVSDLDAVREQIRRGLDEREQQDLERADQSE